MQSNHTIYVYRYFHSQTVSESLVSRVPFNSPVHSIYERCAGIERDPEHTDTRIIKLPKLTQALANISTRIINHIRGATNGHIDCKKATLYFKADNKGKLNLLFISSISTQATISDDADFKGLHNQTKLFEVSPYLLSSQKNTFHCHCCSKPTGTLQ